MHVFYLNTDVWHRWHATHNRCWGIQSEDIANGLVYDWWSPI